MHRGGSNLKGEGWDAVKLLWRGEVVVVVFEGRKRRKRSLLKYSATLLSRVKFWHKAVKITH